MPTSTAVLGLAVSQASVTAQICSCTLISSPRCTPLSRFRPCRRRPSLTGRLPSRIPSQGTNRNQAEGGNGLSAEAGQGGRSVGCFSTRCRVCGQSQVSEGCCGRQASGAAGLPWEPSRGRTWEVWGGNAGSSFTCLLEQLTPRPVGSLRRYHTFPGTQTPWFCRRSLPALPHQECLSVGNQTLFDQVSGSAVDK